MTRNTPPKALGQTSTAERLGELQIGGKDVNAAMLEAAMAWHFDKYDNRQSMADRQKAARKAGTGLWAEPKPIPPLEWRKMSKEERENLIGAKNETSRPGGKRTAPKESHWLPILHTGPVRMGYWCVVCFRSPAQRQPGACVP
ncbi:MAG: hypothetical protein JW395_1556 [Nitrospira sp.]|nr:hypothetical protein [Nitrospira sp.]